MRDARSRRFTACAVFAILCGLAACATVDARPDFADARARIQAATGKDAVYDPEAPLLTPAELDAALADGLGLEEALRLALLNNKRLHAGFMGLGVGRAEYVQAGLLENPTLGLAFLFPSGGGRPKVEADLVASVLEIWQLPRREAVAAAALEQSVLELSRFAGELVLDTKDAYYASVAARDAHAIANENHALAERALTGVRRQVEGGVATTTDENLARNLVLQADLALRRSERDEMTVKRRLAALLALEQDLFPIELTDALPRATAPTQDREVFVECSQRLRLDLRASAAAVATAEAEVALERKRVVSNATAGLAVERPEGGSSTSLLGGFQGSLALPIFDQNQAQIARAEYRREQLTKEHDALLVEVAQEVRAAVDRAAVAARTVQFVEDELLPQAERSAALARKAYELGDTTILVLLDNERAALLARQNGIDARLEAARAQVDLERSLGAPLGAANR